MISLFLRPRLHDLCTRLESAMWDAADELCTTGTANERAVRRAGFVMGARWAVQQIKKHVM